MSPAVALLFLAPLFGELLSLHQTPLEFINPISFVLTALPYGFGAILCRELVIRWKKGWFSLALLGAAYAVYEEFIVARSVWNPNWAELGPLRDYTFSGGFAWTYAEALIHFHVTISILSSVLLAELLFAGRRHETWVTKRGLAVSAIGLALWTPAFWLLAPFTPPLWGLVLSVLLLLGLGYAAWQAPSPLLVPRPGERLSPWWVGAIAALNMSLVFFLGFIAPSLQLSWFPPWPVTLVLVAFLDLAAVSLLARLSGNGAAWSDRHTVMLIGGFLLFFVLLSFLKDLSGGFTGASLVSLLALWGLWTLWKKAPAQSVA